MATCCAATTDKAPPAWAIVSCYVALAAATLFGGWRIAKTMDEKSPGSSRGRLLY